MNLDFWITQKSKSSYNSKARPILRDFWDCFANKKHLMVEVHKIGSVFKKLNLSKKGAGRKTKTLLIVLLEDYIYCE